MARTNAAAEITTNTSISGGWWFVAAVWNSSGGAIYTNGMVNNSGSGDIVTTVPQSDIHIGENWNNGNLLNGRLYCIRFFNNSLSQTDVDLLYNLGQPICEPLRTLLLATESQGDEAILTAITSSVPSTEAHASQQVYVVNDNNDQWAGVADYLVVQTNPQRRWILNYITTGETALNAENLTNVYVLEINETRSLAEITQQVSSFINATKG